MPEPIEKPKQPERPEKAEKPEEELREEIREDARRFILDSLEAGAGPFQILDELAGFYDGDIEDLF